MHAIDLLPVLLIAVVLYRSNATALFSGTLNPDYLSPTSTKSLRGIFALTVVYHHIYQLVGCGLLYPIFTRIGYMPVGFFFFISGYGLMKRSMTVDGYHRSFLRRRLPSILLPYALANFIYWLFHLSQGMRYSLLDIITGVLSGNPIVSNSWYIITIMLCYIFFWLSLCATRNAPPRTVAFNAAFCLLYIAVFIRLGFGTHWVKTVAAFPLGLLWAVCEKRLLKSVRKPYFLLLSVTIALLGCSMLLQMRYANMSAPPVMQAVFCNATIILFVLTMLLIILKLHLGNRILEYFGEHSLEIYMYHGLLMAWARPVLSHPNGAFYYFLIVLAGTIAVAHITHIADQWLLRGWKKLLQIH